MSVLVNNAAIGINVPIQFVATGGTAPYVYSLDTGSVGSVDASTGNFSSPDSGSATVSALDSLGADVGSASVAVLTVFQLICDIIQSEMGLSPGRVWIWDQKIFEPTDQGLFIVANVLSQKSFSNSKSYDGSGSGLNVTQGANMFAQLSLDIKSRNMDAVDRLPEVVLALNSDYAKTQMEANSFFLAPLPQSMINLSESDGSAIPYRFNLTVNVQWIYNKTKATNYFDTFPVTEIFVRN
jgi:hypothetical protein